MHTLVAAAQPEAEPYQETSMDCIGLKVGLGVPAEPWNQGIA